LTKGEIVLDRFNTHTTTQTHPSRNVGPASVRHLLIEQQLKRRFAATDKPRKRTTSESAPGSRHIPNAVRRSVLERDSLRCTFVSQDGKHCGEQGWLELHHEHPFALGGPPSEANIRMLCRAHNQLLAERDFGPLFMQQRRATSSGERSHV
jgi:5-methylcytosine-specific restriction endonuclease McrA